MSEQPGMRAAFCELTSSSLISFSGEDAASFLHGQLTSDIAGLRAPATQYAGYCSAKGRLLATFLVWRLEGEILLQLPRVLHDALQSRLVKYVLRARVKVTDASKRFALFGLADADAADIRMAALNSTLPHVAHQVVPLETGALTLLPLQRYLLLVHEARADDVRVNLEKVAEERDESLWQSLDIEAGIPLITPHTQDEYVPQMVNLDLIGGVSYTKGCYPGQEIVARTHYLGRLKQRMYHARVATHERPAAGDALYSREFGPDQASGKILSAASTAHDGAYDALAVIQTGVARDGNVFWRSLDGPALEFVPLPYAIPT
ncbi:MAG TPA: folate-binding protein [Burkholderiales bacterium]|nr:folate-binding protein [Burkholderiales bacterium]